MSHKNSSLGRLSAPQHLVTTVSKPADSDRLAPNEAATRSTSADRRIHTSPVAPALSDASGVDGAAPTRSVQLSIDVASDSEQASDEWTESAQSRRSPTKARLVRKSRRAQQTLLDVSSGHSQSTAAVAADSHSAPVSAKRSLSSALGSSSSGGSAPKRAKSSVGLAATDELKRSQAKSASLQLRWEGRKEGFAIECLFPQRGHPAARQKAQLQESAPAQRLSFRPGCARRLDAERLASACELTVRPKASTLRPRKRPHCPLEGTHHCKIEFPSLARCS